MIDPRVIAQGVVGPVDWQTEVSGFCPCPGQTLHTHRTGRKDCRVNVDGAPTIHCFHSSCGPAVAGRFVGLCWFWTPAFHHVRGISWEGPKMRKSAINPIKKGLKRWFQAPELVAGVGFEPTAFRL